MAEKLNTRKNINLIDHLHHNIKRLKKELVILSSEEEYQQIADYFKSIEDKMQLEYQALPKGHRYTGTFYLKKPYTIPAESVKIKGSAYMREDLVTWWIESKDEAAKNLWYVRAVYKDKKMTKLLMRKDGEPVYDEPRS